MYACKHLDQTYNKAKLNFKSIGLISFEAEIVDVRIEENTSRKIEIRDTKRYLRKITWIRTGK